jgi:hypothetical protein
VPVLIYRMSARRLTHALKDCIVHDIIDRAYQPHTIISTVMLVA